MEHSKENSASASGHSGAKLARSTGSSGVTRGHESTEVKRLLKFQSLAGNAAVEQRLSVQTQPAAPTSVQQPPLAPQTSPVPPSAKSSVAAHAQAVNSSRVRLAAFNYWLSQGASELDRILSTAWADTVVRPVKEEVNNTKQSLIEQRNTALAAVGVASLVLGGNVTHQFLKGLVEKSAGHALASAGLSAAPGAYGAGLIAASDAVSQSDVEAISISWEAKQIGLRNAAEDRTQRLYKDILSPFISQYYDQCTALSYPGFYALWSQKADKQDDNSYWENWAVEGVLNRSAVDNFVAIAKAQLLKDVEQARGQVLPSVKAALRPYNQWFPHFGF